MEACEVPVCSDPKCHDAMERWVRYYLVGYGVHDLVLAILQAMFQDLLPRSRFPRVSCLVA